MEKLTIAEAKRLNDTMVTEDHLKLHAANVAACMGAMAEHFGADKEHWEAVGYLHDYDYEKYPDEHLAHTEEPLRALGVPEEDLYVEFFGLNHLSWIRSVKLRGEEIMPRLIADDGKAITDGEIVACCIDVRADDAGGWTDCDGPEEGGTDCAVPCREAGMT